MPFKLTSDTFEYLFDKAELCGLAGWQDNDTEAVDWATLPHIGQFRNCDIPLSNGLHINVQEWGMAEDLLHLEDAGQQDTGVCLIFNLSGKVQTNLPNIVGEIEEKVGFYHLENTLDVAETELWQSGEPFQRIYLGIDPFQLVEQFHSSQLVQLPIEIQHTLEGNHRPYYRSHPISSEMAQTLHQILHCPYAGLLKKAYLQGKAWELMALAFAPFLPEASVFTALTLKPEEIERIHHAKNLLIAQLQHPPSLRDLAKQACMNEFSLRQGFQQVFGTTVFRYLHDYRLDLACQLLADHHLRIAEVAQQVGFANRGYFAAAFSKKFGVSPKVYRQWLKNSL
jgi:AraC family transcriptional regulator, transcriptional activator of the genes for pyochelin and ferripyochelin receptors